MIKNKQPDGTRSPHWFTRHKKLVILLSIGVVLLVGGGVATTLYFLNQKPTTTPAKTVKPTPKPDAPKYYSPLSGNMVSTEAETHMAVTGIMIENSPDARPQSGIKDAGVIFEAIAEGGITRFLALYQQEKPQLIGPVRSVRMYYVDWVVAFDASVAHIGGSAAALAEVRNGSYRDIDQFFNSQAYWRATDRYAPHNVYTSFEKLDALNVSKGYLKSNFTGFTRKDSEGLKTPVAVHIDVTMSSALYNSAYDYNVATNSYFRSQVGEPFTDREKGQLTPRVVIVMKVPERTVFEDGYRTQIDAVGTGTAYVFQDGDVHEVTWSKASKTEQIKFTTAEGQDFRLARGQTFISAVPADSGDVMWQ